MSRKPAVEHVDIDLDDMRRRLAASALTDEDKVMFQAVLDTLALVTRELETKRCSVVRLRRLVFGAKTEKLSNLESNAKLEGDAACDESEPNSGRTGTFTTGIVSTVDGHTVVLYQTGRRHAGDNLEHVLSRRDAELPPPIQMCDALSRNASGEFQTILANGLSHARREFADLVSLFKEPCLYVIRQIAKVYQHDDEAQKLGLSPEERLAWHQQHSGPVMDALADWMKTEVAERRIEPNGSLGAAIKYMQKHGSKLTLFLRVAGAPLDNNLCERILKRAILHRKNSLFFRTARGASIADICMSLIQTTELAKKDPLHYLTPLLEHQQQVADSPARWLPWNYQQTVTELEAVAA
jgi:transposase